MRRSFVPRFKACLLPVALTPLQKSVCIFSGAVLSGTATFFIGKQIIESTKDINVIKTIDPIVSKTISPVMEKTFNLFDKYIAPHDESIAFHLFIFSATAFGTIGSSVSLGKVIIQQAKLMWSTTECCKIMRRSAITLPLVTIGSLGIVCLGVLTVVSGYELKRVIEQRFASDDKD